MNMSLSFKQPLPAVPPVYFHASFATKRHQVFKFSFYVIFFGVMFSLYGVPPLNLIRDVYMSFDQLQRRLQAFYRSGSCFSTQGWGVSYRGWRLPIRVGGFP